MNPRVRWFAASAGAALIAASLGLVAFGTQTRSTLVPVVGTWRSTIEDAQPTVIIEGAAPPVSPHRTAIADLFGQHRDTFLAAAGAPGAFPLALARDVPDFRGGRLSVEFKLVSGPSDQTAGIVFNLQPAGSYHFARYNTKDGNVAIWKFENGTRTVLQHGELHEQLPLGTWQRLLVTVTGTSVVATVNERFRVEHTLGASVSGRVGVWTKADSTTAFRRFTTTR